MPTISIILAAYNAEKSIKRMLDSITRQTFRDWELIAIDDGSVDNTGGILDAYAASDCRIKIHHKMNEGVAAARQYGIELAQGEYTIHADSDDWMEPEMLEEMLCVAKNENADIVIADFFTDVDGKSTVRSQKPESVASKDILYGLYAKKLFGSLWHKLIKKSAYDKASAHFIKGINYCEDLLVLTQILSRTKPKISYLPKPFYHYVVNANSLTQSVSPQGFESMKRFHQEAVKLLPTDERYSFIKDSFERNEFLIYFTNRIYGSKKELQKEYIKIKSRISSEYGLRWRLGFYCIRLGMINIAHKLIRF